jgi:hypothetical protein
MFEELGPIIGLALFYFVLSLLGKLGQRGKEAGKGGARERAPRRRMAPRGTDAPGRSLRTACVTRGQPAPCARNCLQTIELHEEKILAEKCCFLDSIGGEWEP